MARFTALFLAGLGTLDLLLIDVALVPLVLQPTNVQAASPTRTLRASNPQARGMEVEQARSRLDSEPTSAPDEVVAANAPDLASPTPTKPAEKSRPTLSEAMQTLPPLEPSERHRFALPRDARRTYHLQFPMAKQDWVPAAAKTPLTTIAQRILASPTHRVLVLGYADARGAKQDNQELGVRRADVIADYLVKLGVERSRIETRAFGEDHPAISGATRYAWSKNRRVQIVLKPTSRSQSQ